MHRQLRPQLSPGHPCVPWLPGLQQVWGREDHGSSRYTGGGSGFSDGAHQGSVEEKAKKTPFPQQNRRPF